jgi:hypothetical protein
MSLNFGIVRMLRCETSGAGFETVGGSAPPVDVFHVCRPREFVFYSTNAPVNLFTKFKKL